MEGPDDHLFKYVKNTLIYGIASLLGPSGLTALEHHLNRKLGRDMYEVFYYSPNVFYNALRSFLGSGADAILKIVVSKLIDEGRITGITPKEFLELISKDDESFRRKLLRSFRGGLR
ncbi:MAG: hypothetical protein NZ929_00255 [Aigarchaeota archaeon]|nr:hypothetical protein [Aigarchaeota archaeon]MCX8193145.1 hypothetical protein [Nitrososphaeria archaeon]MDW7986768.1 hypothetical protein [Nitrososphaerota archaeon]